MSRICRALFGRHASAQSNRCRLSQFFVYLGQLFVCLGQPQETNKKKIEKNEPATRMQKTIVTKN
ncbi:hypothetical protein M5D96_006785 [Drosophila gunungcola]|uniref:Uncharacterized protein n=1 Tax=Drosophila gunungcola TaxID=103775 RepID=A0A9P9YPT6_9MUSC|nr:hypothetical protein M5D96_006785 [Drosophila gunungcola]